ncbi:MAG: hypothetical protein Q4D41_08395, partial [Prevotellaceae bacterium]|nr:hypothetical protein [Prevotellaceae bacterium]
MKKNLSIIALAITLGFTSCSEEDCDHIASDSSSSTSTTNSIVGSWYEEAENEEIRLNENGTFYDKYCNTRLCGEVEGRWEYDKDNSKLTWTYSYSGQTQYADWAINNHTEFSFTIYSETVGSHILEKIVETYELEVGETVDIQFPTSYPSYTVQSYESKNERLASVTSDGKITAEGEKGCTYIKIKTSTGNVWVKVIVGDDCLDLWYDYQSLIGVNYSTLRNVLGTPSITGEDGYSYGFTTTYHDYIKEVDVFLNQSTGLVEEIQLLFRVGVAESQLLSYLNTHYYTWTYDSYYTTSPVL